MSSIYTNLASDKQYKAATGLSIAEFESLYEQFSELYIPKSGNPYSKKTAPVLTHKREALFYIIINLIPRCKTWAYTLAFPNLLPAIIWTYSKPFSKQAWKDILP